VKTKTTSSLKKKGSFPSAMEDARAAELCAKSQQTLSPAYRLAFRDHDFLLLDELRPVRLQLELLKPELILNEHRIEGTIIIFGGTGCQAKNDTKKIKELHFFRLEEQNVIRIYNKDTPNVCFFQYDKRKGCPNEAF